MEEIKVSDKEVIKKSLRVLKEGGLIIYPTETSYGIGCDFFNKKAVERIYKIKKRETGKPLPVIIPSINYISKIVKVNKKIKDLIKEYWPGPLTLVLDLIKKPYRDYKFKSLALRLSSDQFASELCKKFKKPIISTSANISGKSNIYNPKEIKKYKIDVDLFINAGILKKVKPSTIVSLEKDKIKILRKGVINVNI